MRFRTIRALFTFFYQALYCRRILSDGEYGLYRAFNIIDTAVYFENALRTIEL